MSIVSSRMVYYYLNTINLHIWRSNKPNIGSCPLTLLSNKISKSNSDHKTVISYFREEIVPSIVSLGILAWISHQQDFIGSLVEAPDVGVIEGNYFSKQ